jgi:hypothetical protein
MQLLFLPFIGYFPDIEEQRRELFGHLHAGDI